MNQSVLSRQELAIHGGSPAIQRTFTRYNPIGAEEVEAARGVIESGVLSQFIGAWSPDFFGGPCVRSFEAAAAQYFGVKHAITVNSLTSGLIAAVGAADVEPGDEVIVSPWTMSASATAVLHWNAIPVFADIDPRTFCLDPRSIESNITPRTRAIVAVDIFGQSADIAAIRAIAAKHDLRVISDTAQAPGARVGNRYAGTLADLGGFSLNYHKHIHTGEGGIVVTDNDRFAERVQLIRNHAEAVVGAKGVDDLSNMLGYNFRLGEIEAAIGQSQLGKLDAFVATRQAAAARLTAGLAELPGVYAPYVTPGNTHVYYVYPLVVDVHAIAVNRNALCAALRAEGVPGVMAGYQNVHLLPLYQRKIAYGRSGFPWTAPFCSHDVDYSKGICPVAEALQDETFIGLALCAYEFGRGEVDDVIGAFHKVWANLDSLRNERSVR